MTIKLREWLFWIICAVSAAFVGLAVLMFTWLGVGGITQVQKTAFPARSGFEFYTMVAIAVLCVTLAFLCTLLLAFNMRKTVSVEIFFFGIWAFCQAFELIKIASICLMYKNAGANLFAIGTRIALWGRYSALLALFAGSLFASGLKQERTISALMAVFLSGLLFASIHPLNSAGIGSDLLSDRGLQHVDSIFNVSIVILTLSNYLVAWRSGKDKEYLIAGLAAALCAAASIILKDSTVIWIAALCIIAISSGILLHIRSLHRYYLWR